ncbi:MAG: OmpA family protein, partial [Rhodanobacter sp.]
MRILVACLLLFGTAGTLAQTPPTSATTQNGKVIVSGIVPNETTKVAVLEQLRKQYGTDQVVDQLEVGGVVAPANWSRYVTAMIGPELKNVSKGQLQVQGNTIEISGEVPDEVARQNVLSSLSSAFDPHYGIKQTLRIGQSRQKVLDDTLANRTVEFRSGSAVLTPEGRAVLDQMAAAILKLDSPFINVIGNTDDVGNRQANIELSLARASSVKAYLISAGVLATNLSISGQGPDNPIADNATDAGRAR